MNARLKHINWKSVFCRHNTVLNFRKDNMFQKVSYSRWFFEHHIWHIQYECLFLFYILSIVPTTTPMVENHPVNEPFRAFSLQYNPKMANKFNLWKFSSYSKYSWFSTKVLCFWSLGCKWTFIDFLCTVYSQGFTNSYKFILVEVFFQSAHKSPLSRVMIIFIRKTPVNFVPEVKRDLNLVVFEKTCCFFHIWGWKVQKIMPCNSPFRFIALKRA